MANPFKFDLFRGFFVLVFVAALTSWVQAQQPPTSNRDRNDRGDRGDRRGFNPEEMRNRMLSNLREQFEVTNDEEWNIIVERITKVFDLRRQPGMAGGRGGFMGGPGGPGGPDRSRTPSSSGNQEMDGLRSAVQAKATDAELKARLTRLREMRKETEQRLEKAQEELRAVLTVRQEAILVMYGLLP